MTGTTSSLPSASSIGNIFYLIGLTIIISSVIACFYCSFEIDKADKTKERFLEQISKR